MLSAGGYAETLIQSFRGMSDALRGSHGRATCTKNSTRPNLAWNPKKGPMKTPRLFKGSIHMYIHKHIHIHRYIYIYVKNYIIL